MVEYFLALDELRQGDTVLQMNGFDVAYDRKAEEEIGTYVKIDYRLSGFVLINKSQTLAYGLRININ